MQDSKTILQAMKRWKAIARIFRVEIDGFENIPDGPALFVANHNSGAWIESAALIEAWHTRFPGKAIYGLAHAYGFKLPGISQYIRKVGAIPATYESALSALNSGASLLIYPGGNWEVARPFTERNICDFGNHYGWAKIAFRANCKIVPISIVGSHSVNPVLLRSKLLSIILVIPKILGLNYFLVSVGQLFWSFSVFFITKEFLPMWIVIPIVIFVFLTTPLVPIWPAKIKIRFGRPLNFERESQEKFIKLAYDGVIKELQKGMDDLRKISN